MIFMFLIRLFLKTQGVGNYFRAYVKSLGKFTIKIAFVTYSLCSAVSHKCHIQSVTF